MGIGNWMRHGTATGSSHSQPGNSPMSTASERTCGLVAYNVWKFSALALGSVHLFPIAICKFLRFTKPCLQVGRFICIRNLEHLPVFLPCHARILENGVMDHAGVLDTRRHDSLAKVFGVVVQGACWRAGTRANEPAGW